MTDDETRLLILLEAALKLAAKITHGQPPMAAAIWATGVVGPLRDAAVAAKGVMSCGWEDKTS